MWLYLIKMRREVFEKFLREKKVIQHELTITQWSRIMKMVPPLIIKKQRKKYFRYRLSYQKVLFILLKTRQINTLSTIKLVAQWPNTKHTS